MAGRCTDDYESRAKVVVYLGGELGYAPKVAECDVGLSAVRVFEGATETCFTKCEVFEKGSHVEVVVVELCECFAVVVLYRK